MLKGITRWSQRTGCFFLWLHEARPPTKTTEWWTPRQRAENKGCIEERLNASTQHDIIPLCCSSLQCYFFYYCMSFKHFMLQPSTTLVLEWVLFFSSSDEFFSSVQPQQIGSSYTHAFKVDQAASVLVEWHHLYANLQFDTTVEAVQGI